ncbi:MAG TPA: PQQ-binding-like beta-propeller repeat protein [Planctomycetota bacterium]|nr:PQQ-binding-like beta-propeller repeat protein [Planctomycetota bacterium]
MSRLAPLLAALLLTPLAAEEAPPAGRLGSAEFRPSPERPFGWRGDGSGRYLGATPVTEWSPTKNIRWTAVVGKSYSSPVVTDKLVLALSEPDLLICLDRADGKEKWRMKVTSADLQDAAEKETADQYLAKDTGHTAATPVTDGATVYAAFANGIVRAATLEGKTKWTAFVEARQNTAYGRSSSPILVAGKLILHMTNLYAFDPATGKRLWVNEEAKCQYGTPACLRQGKVDLIVTCAGDVIRCDDGKKVNDQIGNTSNSSPVAMDGLIYFGEKDVRAIKLGAEFKDESVWNGEIMGDVFGSPLLHGGLLYTVSGKGDLIAFDAGKKGATEPVIDMRPLFGDDVGAQPILYSSVTLAGKYLFVSSNLGDIVVLEATKEAKVVAKNRIKDGSGASPVFSGRDLFLRDGDRLLCIGN